MEQSIEIVEAGSEDSDLVAELVYELLIEIVPEQSDYFPLPKLKRAAANLLVPGSGVWSFLARQDDKVIGMINLNECSAIYAGGNFGEITELYIRPEFRSNNIGARLIGHARSFAREKNWDLLEVGAPDLPRWQKTVNFYLENGFTLVGPRLEIDI